MNHRNLFSLLVTACAAACTGYATTPYGSAEVTGAQMQPAGPEDVIGPDPGIDYDTAPEVVYEGHPTYYAHDRWYYRGNEGRWHYYRNEPNELRMHRQGFENNRNRNFNNRAQPATRERNNVRPAEPRNMDRDRDRR